MVKAPQRILILSNDTVQSLYNAMLRAPAVADPRFPERGFICIKGWVVRFADFIYFS